MDNVLAARLGAACESATVYRAVDSIDRGLGLQRDLENADFLVFVKGSAKPEAERVLSS
jgi:hypothetical protein